MPDRRTFLITCAGVVAVPSVAHWGLTSAVCAVPASPLAILPTPALRIEGWDSAGDSGDVWIQINSSWRANWR